MKIINIGDQVIEGVFSLHSAYRNVLNFNDGNRLVSLVTRSVGEGPSYICVDEILPDAKQLIINKSFIELDGFIFPISDVSVYDSAFPQPCMSEQILNERLLFIENSLLNFEINSPLKNAFFNSPESNLGMFDATLAKTFANAFVEIFSKDYISGLTKIKGLGYGSTPTGDDFICGYLLASHYFDLLKKFNHSTERQLIWELAVSGNKLSNTFLYNSFKGFLYGKTKKLVSSLNQHKPDIIAGSLSEVLSMGASSGFDTMVGFVMTLKYFIHDNKRNY